jgi:2-(1,2-epoxy-1,2-dihydrophenyl)acetyl-CoA isomerase
MTIRVEDVDDHVRVFTLDRPEVMNATSIADIEELDALVAVAEADERVRCVVLTGAGEAFCAGNDIHEMKGLDADEMGLMELRRRDPTYRWATAAVPTIAAINGACYGNGTILAVGSDLRVGGPATRMKVTATSYGGANLTWNLPALVGEAHARDLLLTGRVVDGEEAFRMGLLNRFASDGDVVGEALRLAAVIAKNPPSGPVTVKRLINAAVGTTRQAQFDREHATQMASILQGHAEHVFDAFHDRSAQRRAAAVGADGRGEQ